MSNAEFLVDAAWLDRHAHSADVVLLDARASIDYWSGHLPGARHFDAFALSHPDTSPAGLDSLVRHYEYLFGLLGLSGDEYVVVYEARSDARAARAAWLLEYLGHPRVRLLDGGLEFLDRPVLETAGPVHAARRFVARRRDAQVISADALAARLGEPDLQVIDTRRSSEFYGHERRGKRVGAVPGAVHRDYADNIAADGRFKPASEIRAAYEALGVSDGNPVVTYCGGGARAAHTLYALRLAGFADVANYTGSWSEWSERDDLPVTLPVEPVTA